MVKYGVFVIGALILSVVIIIVLALKSSRQSWQLFVLGKKVSQVKKEKEEISSEYQLLIEAVKQEAIGWPVYTEEGLPPKPVEPRNPIRIFTEEMQSCACPNGSGYGCTGSPETCIEYEEALRDYRSELELYERNLVDWNSKYTDEMVHVCELKKIIDSYRKGVS